MIRLIGRRRGWPMTAIGLAIAAMTVIAGPAFGDEGSAGHTDGPATKLSTVPWGTPTASPSQSEAAPGAAGHDAGDMDMSGHDAGDMDMSGGTSHEPATGVDAGDGGHGHASNPDDRANWWVVGAFLAMIGMATVAAAGTKRRLARKMAAGELAGAGVRNG